MAKEVVKKEIDRSWAFEMLIILNLNRASILRVIVVASESMPTMPAESK